jgi:hypothetical protein
MNVKTHGCKITIILDQKALKSSLKQMTTSLMPAVKPDRIAYAQPLDRSGKIGFSRSNEEVIVVFHQDIGMDL